MPNDAKYTNDLPDEGRSTRRRFLAAAAAGGASLACGTGAYMHWVEPHWVTTVEQPMPLTGLSDAMQGKRLVQISDLHVGPVVSEEYLKRAIRQVVELEPDYLAITGDFMTTVASEQIAPTLQLLRELPLASTPTVAVLGNHDFGAHCNNRGVAAELADGLKRLGIQVLRNQAVNIDGLQFAGSGDLWAGECGVWQSLDRIDSQKPTVFLAHNPDTADLPGWGDFQGWILSGHTHGGQCRLPGWGAPVLPIRNRRYAAGHIPLSEGRNLYVNRGLGYSKQVRFAAPPEITLFTLQAKG